MSFVRSLFWVLVLFCSATILNAQFDSGSILGTVREVNGGVVPEVSISLESLSTGILKTTISNGVGDYTFLSIPAGDYVVTARHTGFKDATTSAFTVTVGARQRVDLVFYPATVSQQVVVAAAAVLAAGIFGGIFAWLGVASQHVAISFTNLLGAGLNTVPAGPLFWDSERSHGASLLVWPRLPSTGSSRGPSSSNFSDGS